jgi:hypothetical protein
LKRRDFFANAAIFLLNVAGFLAVLRFFFETFRDFSQGRGLNPGDGVFPASPGYFWHRWGIFGMTASLSGLLSRTEVDNLDLNSNGT